MSSIKCGFGCLRTFEGRKDFDSEYTDITIKKVAVKTGEGEEDFIIQDKEVISKTPIKEVIESQRNAAGMDAYLSLMSQRGESVQPVQVSDKIDDFSNMPEDLAAVVALGENIKSLYSRIPEGLKKNLNVEDFLSSVSADNIKKYYESKVKKIDPKKEEVK